RGGCAPSGGPARRRAGPPRGGGGGGGGGGRGPPPRPRPRPPLRCRPRLPAMTTRPLAVLFLLSSLTVAPAQLAPAPCFDSDYGTFIGQGDDDLLGPVTLSAPFSFYGVNYNEVTVSTNGFIWLGNPTPGSVTSRCCSGNGTPFVQDPPSIAIFWTDLVMDTVGSGVYVHSYPGRDVITWRNAHEFGGIAFFTLQMQLLTGGQIVLWWRPATTATASNHAMLVGAPPGNGAVDPGSIDISASLPFTSTQPTVYERFLPTTFDLAARTIELLPNGTSGFVLLDRPSCLFTGGGIFPTGTGCPAGAELTQSFP